MIGTLAAIPVGAVFLRSAPGALIRVLLDYIVLSFSILFLAGWIKPKEGNRN